MIYLIRSKKMRYENIFPLGAIQLLRTYERGRDGSSVPVRTHVKRGLRIESFCVRLIRRHLNQSFNLKL